MPSNTREIYLSKSLAYTPNALSFLRIALSPFVFSTLMMGHKWALVSAALFSLSAITDFVDGKIAKKYRLISSVGIFLDPLADKLLILPTFYAFYLKSDVLCPLWVFLILSGREIVITLLRFFMARDEQNLPASSMGKIKTVLQMLTIMSMYLAIIVDQFSLFGENHLLIGMLCLFFVKILTYSAVATSIISGGSYFLQTLEKNE